jgi:hypothetical protein
MKTATKQTAQNRLSAEQIIQKKIAKIKPLLKNIDFSNLPKPSDLVEK